MKKPKMLPSWDENKRIVINSKGDRYELFKDRAHEVYDASLRLYNKKKAR